MVKLLLCYPEYPEAAAGMRICPGGYKSGYKEYANTPRGVLPRVFHLVADLGVDSATAVGVSPVPFRTVATSPPGIGLKVEGFQANGRQRDANRSSRAPTTSKRPDPYPDPASDLGSEGRI